MLSFASEAFYMPILLDIYWTAYDRVCCKGVQIKWDMSLCGPCDGSVTVCMIYCSRKTEATDNIREAIP